VGPDIRKLMKDEKFEACMTKVETEAWSSFKEVVNKFLGNYKDPNFKQIVQSMLENFKKLGCSVSLKVHFLMCHLDYIFLKILVPSVRNTVKDFTKALSRWNADTKVDGTKT